MRRIQPKTILLSTLLSSMLLASGEYKATIVDNAECAPVAQNDRPSAGMQKNRRVDLFMETKEQQIKQVPHVESVSSRIYLNPNATLWATSDPLVNTPKLAITADTIYLGAKGEPEMRFYTYNNYSDYIDRYEIDLYLDREGETPRKIQTIKGDGLPDEVSFDLHKIKLHLTPKTKLQYRLKVFDKSGDSDVTRLKRVLIEKGRREDAFIDLAGSIFGKSDIENRGISIEGSRVRVYGEGLNPDYLLKIDNQEVRVDSQGKFVYEQIRKGGKYTIPVTVMTDKGETFDEALALNVKKNHIFMVGLADFTVGKYDVSGNIKPLEADDHFDEDIFIDGRLAFYLKGKIKGKYLLTAQLDTQESEIKNIFKGLQKKDPKRLFRHLDPDQYYYLYGDDSHSFKDTDTQGRFYLSLAWDKSKALWGNYNTGVTGNEFANVNRSLYGAKFQHSSMQKTKFGDNKRDVTLYASEAQNAYAHNEFDATGGSLYYLKHKEIVEGSEKIWVEVRERNSQRVTQKIELKRGQDYEIDEIQGRIILTRPLSPYSDMDGPSIIKDMPLDGNRVLLKVDYEYLPDDFKANQATYGGRVKEWLTDYLGVGATYGHEGRSSGDYEVSGMDVTLRGGKNSFIKAEVAHSKAVQSNGANFRSLDGGLSFEQIDSNESDPSGNAYGVEAQIALSDFKKTTHESVASLWYKKRENGFSNARLGGTQEVEDMGVEATSHLSKRLISKARATSLKEGVNKEKTASIETDMQIAKRWRVGAELRAIESRRDDKKVASATLAGLRANYALNSYLNLYLKAQNTLDNQGEYEKNDLYSIGTKYTHGRATFDAEASTGDRGESAKVGVEYGVTKDISLYTNYILSTDSTEGQRDTLTLGQRSKLNDKLSIFSEHQFSHEDKMAGLGNTFGINYAFSRYLSAGVTYNKVSYDDVKRRDRESLSTALRYTNKRVEARTKFEYRKDNGQSLDQKQYLTTNYLSYALNPSWRVMARFNYSKTDDEVLDKEIARFIESGVGFAYRPVENSRFNLIGKYTYLYDLPTLDQIKNHPIEKSHIFEMEDSYQLSSKWSFGSKLGYKQQQTKADREEGQWYKSDIYLGALRANYHLIKKWDALGEVHWLKQKDDGVREGYLLGLYRHIGSHIKLGVGYNFSHFSDDLRSADDYDAKGWFVNVIGKF